MRSPMLAVLAFLFLFPLSVSAQTLVWDHSEDDIDGNHISEEISYNVYSGSEPIQENMTLKKTVTEKRIKYSDARIKPGDYVYVSAQFMRDGVKHMSRPSEIVRVLEFRININLSLEFNIEVDSGGSH